MSSQYGKGSHIQAAVTECCHITTACYKFYLVPLHITSCVHYTIFNYLRLYEAETWYVTFTFKNLASYI